MNTSGDNHEREPDPDIARLLEAAGPREPVPGELKERWETHFRAELTAVRRARLRRRVLSLSAVAAGIVAFALVFERPTAPNADPVSTRIVAVTGSVDLVSPDNRRQPASAGLKLATGGVLETGTGSRVAVDWAGFDVRLNEQTRLRLAGKQLQLESGEVYVSNRAQGTARQVATVVTPLATVRDIGTQFKVRYDGRTVSASVREGSIEVQTPQTRQRAEATPGNYRTMLVNANGEVETAEDTSDWTWIYPVSRPFTLEGQSVQSFLEWAAAESGRELRFVDSATRLSASYTRFSGEIELEGLAPEEAVATVLSTTRFRASTENNALLVSRRRSE